VPDAAALALDLAHLHVGVVLVDPEAFAEVEGLLEIPAELLDDMPGWSRVAQVGKLLVWHRNP